MRILYSEIVKGEHAMEGFGEELDLASNEGRDCKFGKD